MNTLITTAISYANSSPHIGHLYESILGDFVKKIFILKGSNVKLLTGTDEHGKKICDTAKKNNMTPIELCDKYSAEFKKLNDDLKTSYDYFIRTTELDHKQLVIDIIKKCPGIYLGTYSGWYSVREENYLTEEESKLTNYKDPQTQIPYEKIEEKVYFFALSQYKNFIQEYFQELNIPECIKKNLGSRVNDLKDLSISRTTFDWGIPMPLNLDPNPLNNHVIYVWFDALLNYVTGKNKLFGNEPTEIIHIIGKDIIWFHSVIYPSILKSVEKTDLISNSIIVHGFIMDKNGNKMSKSIGNTIGVDYLITKYPIESIRYYLLSNTKINEDILFSEDSLKSTYNNELIKNFGNLVQRIYSLVSPIQSFIPNYLLSNTQLIEDFRSQVKNHLDKFTCQFNFSEYIEEVMKFNKDLNKFITDKKPWEKTLDTSNELVDIMGNLILSLDWLMILFYPIIPDKIDYLRDIFGFMKISNKIIETYVPTFNLKNVQLKAFSFIK